MRDRPTGALVGCGRRCAGLRRRAGACVTRHLDGQALVAGAWHTGNEPVASPAVGSLIKKRRKRMRKKKHKKMLRRTRHQRK